MRDSSADVARWTAFGRWVKRALRDAKDIRGWSQARVAAESEVGRATLNRWMNVQIRRDPTPANVNAFCRALGLDPAEPYRLLKWRSEEPPRNADPMLPAEVEALMRKLRDPTVPEAEKAEIVRHVEWLARRAPQPDPHARRRNTG